MPKDTKEQKGSRMKMATSQQQQAYAQLIKKEEHVAQNTVSKDLRRLEPLFNVNNNYLHIFKKNDLNNSSVRIGRSLQDIDLTGVDPTKERKKNSSSNPLLFEKQQEPYQYCPKDAKDKSYSREQFLNQPLGKDLYKVPIKSNDQYGWLPPIDNFVQCGYGLTIYEGGVEFTKPLFRGSVNKEKAPAK